MPRIIGLPGNIACGKTAVEFMRGTSHCWAQYTSHRLLLTEAFCVHGTSSICTSVSSMALAKRVSSGDQAIA